MGPRVTRIRGLLAGDASAQGRAPRPASDAKPHALWMVLGLQLAISIYGGYFGGGTGT
jgi:hypothetical protein